MLKVFHSLLLLLLTLGLGAQENDVPENWTDQQVLVARLTGALPISEGESLGSRWTAGERKQSRLYLRDCFSKIGLTLHEQAYRMPNLYALQDVLLGPFRGANLYGILPATTPSKRYILLGAHYDTERHAPGANDNASAMAVIYGVIRALQPLAKRDQNVLFVFFDQEEEDNVGSRAFLQFLARQPWEITSVHTIDQMGWDQDGDRAIEIELATPTLVPYYQAASEALAIPIHQTRVNASDHQAFREAGYTVTGITEEFANGDTSPHKDTPADTFDTVNFAYVASTTEFMSKVVQLLLQGQ